MLSSECDIDSIIQWPYATCERMLRCCPCMLVYLLRCWPWYTICCTWCYRFILCIGTIACVHYIANNDHSMITEVSLNEWHILSWLQNWSHVNGTGDPFTVGSSINSDENVSSNMMVMALLLLVPEDPDAMNDGAQDSLLVLDPSIIMIMMDRYWWPTQWPGLMDLHISISLPH